MALYSGGGAGGSLPRYSPPSTARTYANPMAGGITSYRSPTAAVANYVRQMQQYQARLRARAEAQRRAAEQARRQMQQRAAQARAEEAWRQRVRLQAAARQAAQNLPLIMRGMEPEQPEQPYEPNPYLPLILRGMPRTMQGGPSTQYRGTVLDIPNMILNKRIAGGTVLEWMNELTGRDPRQYTGPEMPTAAAAAPTTSRYSGSSYGGGSRYYGGYRSSGGYSSGGGGGTTEEEEQRPPIWIPPQILWRL